MQVSRVRGRVAAAVVLAVVMTGCGTHAGGGREYTPQNVPEALGKDGASIVVGDPQAPVTVRMYEDPRCPVCEEFEQEGGADGLEDFTRRHRVRTEYVMASFLDDRAGSGSKRAVNALRAALEAGKFVEYHEVLFDHQPVEQITGYTEADLLKLANQVEGLRSPAFDQAVKTMKYRDFVTAAQKAYDRSTPDGRGPGTPNAEINGRMMPEDYRGHLFDTTGLTNLLRMIQADPSGWDDAVNRANSSAPPLDSGN
ncbi:thioredoxin domain-containing protein [Streptomyces sp. NPDC001941]|uniref:DsbA family protein n=1 Tax=Streptomyces sp. NPDC001941 TaxID=3154659 RepID=UPI0033237A5C